MFTFPVSHWSSDAPQEITLTGGTNVVLTSEAAFTALNSAKPIIVTLTGAYNGSTTSVYGFDCGNLSTYSDVTIIIASGATIRGDGGNGGRGGLSTGATGGAGGTAFNANSNNNSTILKITNNGTISPDVEFSASAIASSTRS